MSRMRWTNSPSTRHSAKPTIRTKPMTAYDKDNIFAKILRGEMPAFKVYEDDKTYAFLDIMPRCPGHTLVIPKAPARNVFDIAPDDFAAVARSTQKIAIAVKKAFAA